MAYGPRLSGTWPQRTAVCPLGRAWPAPWTRDRRPAIPGGLRRCPMRMSPSSSAWPDNACAYGVSPAPTMAPLSCRPPRPCPMTLTCDTRYALSAQLGNRHPRRPVAQGIRREWGQRSGRRVDPEGGHAARCLAGGEEKLVLRVQAEGVGDRLGGHPARGGQLSRGGIDRKARDAVVAPVGSIQEPPAVYLQPAGKSSRSKIR